MPAFGNHGLWASLNLFLLFRGLFLMMLAFGAAGLFVSSLTREERTRDKTATTLTDSQRA